MTEDGPPTYSYKKKDNAVDAEDLTANNDADASPPIGTSTKGPAPPSGPAAGTGNSGKEKGKGKASSAPSASKSLSDSAGSVHLVLQRFRYCRLLVDNRKWVEVGTNPIEDEVEEAPSASHGANEDRGESFASPSSTSSAFCGLLVYASFAPTANEDAVRRAAQALVRLPVLTRGLWGDGSSRPESLLDLLTPESGCTSEGPPRLAPTTALVLVPQANLISKCRSGGKSLQYHGQMGKEQGQVLYHFLVRCLQVVVLEGAYQRLGKPLPDWYFPRSASSVGSIVPHAAGTKLGKDWEAASEATAAAAGSRSAANELDSGGVDWASCTDDNRWMAAVSPYCPVLAGTFGARQGLRLDSDMGPFCHVLRLP